MFDEFEEPEDFDAEKPVNAPVSGLASPREGLATLGHVEIERSLLAAFNDGRLPHALIFAGPTGVGKATFGFRVAKFLLAQENALDVGPSLFGDAPVQVKAESFDVPAQNSNAIKIANGAHPNLLFIERLFDEKKNKRQKDIIIDEARKVPPFMHLTAADGGWRVAIIDDAETMNKYTQNALLKILEEPPPKALLIIITHNLSRILPTIRSRCRTIVFSQPSMEDFSELLSRGGSIAKGQVQLLHGLTGGSVGQALAFSQAGGLETLATILTLLNTLPGVDWPQVHAFAEQVGRYGDDEQWEAYQAVMRWITDEMVRTKATGRTLSASLEGSAVVRILNEYSLSALLSLRERVTQMLDTTDHANLERRQTVLGLFTALTQKEEF